MENEPVAWDEVSDVHPPRNRPSSVVALRGLVASIILQALDDVRDHNVDHVHEHICQKCVLRDEAQRWLSGGDQGGVTLAACVEMLGLERDRLWEDVRPCEQCISLSPKSAQAPAESPALLGLEAGRARPKRRHPVPDPQSHVLVTTPGGPIWMPLDGKQPMPRLDLAASTAAVVTTRRGRVVRHHGERSVRACRSIHSTSAESEEGDRPRV